jgi:hypothetical protein
MTIILVMFAVVFALNVIPAFASPTLMTLSFVGLTIPRVNVIVVAAVGAAAATLGLVLCKLSRVILRRRLLSEDALACGVAQTPANTRIPLESRCGLAIPLPCSGHKCRGELTAQNAFGSLMVMRVEWPIPLL